MRSVIPWSFSSWDAYNTCPKQFYETKIAKNWPVEMTEYMIWGNTVHKAIEDYIKEGKDIPLVMQRFKPIVDKIIDKPGDTYAELELACTQDLKPTGFWDANAWCRGKGDVLKVNQYVAFNGDWKTGKVKPNSKQLDLMAVMTFAAFPEVQIALTAFIWFQEPSKPTLGRYVRADVPRLIKQFEEGVRNMEWSQQNNVWPAKPSGLCHGWCPVKTCLHWRPKRERR